MDLSKVEDVLLKIFDKENSSNCRAIKTYK